MSVDPKVVSQRWDLIRNNEEECDLSLSPASVAYYLSRPESELVKERIVESLIQFADWRLDSDNKGRFVNINDRASEAGEMTTCEGLEAFLIPAVERALPFSEFLEQYAEQHTETEAFDKEAFPKAIVSDINGLLDNWEKGLFPGEPYASSRKIQASVLATKRDDFKNINITESAALACRVLIHVLTLKLNRPEEALFHKEISDALDDDRLFNALGKAIDFLVRAFQKGQGETEDERIAKARVGTEIGSGWSWTDRAGLPPMLFFTAAAVDAFAELDLYLIRTVLKKQFTLEAHRLVGFYKDNQEKLRQYELCVDMARRWVGKVVLPFLIDGYGQCDEKLVQGRDESSGDLGYEKEPKGYDQYTDDLAKIEKLSEPPMVFYNSLYALLILLWSWGDRKNEDDAVETSAKSKINRAISQLVYNYSSLPVVKDILTRFNYVFYLPGKDIFKPGTEKERDYLDSAFLPLLTRLLVLFVVYGVGDRNMLEPVIRNLYVELLQSRYRTRIEYSALWSTDEIKVFSTQRAIQALTFYYAYAGGKEIVEVKSSGGGVAIRNRTNLPLILELGYDRADETPRLGVQEVERPKVEDTEKITADDFYGYCGQADSSFKVPDFVDNDEAKQIQIAARKLGEQVISGYKDGKAENAGAVRLILNSIKSITQVPVSKDGTRISELGLLKKQYEELVKSSAPDQG